MFEDLSRIIDHQLYLSLKQSLNERRGESGPGSAAGGGGSGGGHGHGDGDGAPHGEESGRNIPSAPDPSDDATPPGGSPVRHAGGVGAGSRRSSSSSSSRTGGREHREGDDAQLGASLARLGLGLGGPGASMYYGLGGEETPPQVVHPRVVGSSSRGSGDEDISRGRSMLRRGRRRRRRPPYHEGDDEDEDEEGEEDREDVAAGRDDIIHENKSGVARVWRTRGGRISKPRLFRPPAVEVEEELDMGDQDEGVYGATSFVSPQALRTRWDHAPPHHPVEEDDIYGATPPLSAQSPETSTTEHISHHSRPPYPPPLPPPEPEPEPVSEPVPPLRPTTNTNNSTTDPPASNWPPPLPDPSPDPTTTSSSFFPAITSLTLIAEDVPELVAFYTLVFADDAIDLLPGADAESASLALGRGSSYCSPSSSFSSSSPAAAAPPPPPLVVHLLSSREARRRRALGPHVRVGRRRDAGRRLLLGVRVRGLDGVYERLLELEGGGSSGGGGQTGGTAAAAGGGGGMWPWGGWMGWRAWKMGGLVNELTVPAEKRAGVHMGTGVGGMRSVMFWDPAGHCWEVWEDLSPVPDGWAGT